MRQYLGMSACEKDCYIIDNMIIPQVTSRLSGTNNELSKFEHYPLTFGPKSIVFLLRLN